MTRSGLLESPLALMDTTMDQLRTLVVVHETGTALGAARALGREQASVQKQLDTMNRNFSELCGEPLVLKQGRGKDVLFTGTGAALVELARGTLDDWLDGIHDSRRRLGRSADRSRQRDDRCALPSRDVPRTGRRDHPA